MINLIYQLLVRMGYTHPIHAPLASLPPGLAVGALLFSLAALIFQRTNLMQTARHCTILFFCPSVSCGADGIFGLAALLRGRLALSYQDQGGAHLGAPDPHPHWAHLRADARAKGALIIYVLCFLAVVGLGFFGGHLVFGRKCPTAAEGYQAGEQIFEATCSSCHPYGGNIVNPNFPLRGAPQLKDFQTFLAFTRNPKRPDGSEGTMPSFPPSKLSDQQAWELYQYIMNALQSAKPK